MSFTLTMSGVIVGRSELETRDPQRRVASGAFWPGLGYELAEPVFSLYDASGSDPEALRRYERARDALRLQLTDAAGSVIALRDVHIVRVSGSGAAGYVIRVETDDPRVWTAPSAG